MDVDNHLGDENQVNLNMTPSNARPLITQNNIQPKVLFNVIKQKGVYVPAINTNIMEWSILRNQEITLSFAITI